LIPQPENTSLYPISFALSSSPVAYITGLKRRLQEIHFGIVQGLIKFFGDEPLKKMPIATEKQKEKEKLNFGNLCN